MDGRHFVFWLRYKNRIKSKLKASFNIECVSIQGTILPVARNKQLSKFDTKIFGNIYLI